MLSDPMGDSLIAKSESEPASKEKEVNELLGVLDTISSTKPKKIYKD